MYMLLADKVWLLKRLPEGSYNALQPLAIRAVSSVLPIPSNDTTGYAGVCLHDAHLRSTKHRLLALCGMDSGALRLVEVTQNMHHAHVVPCDGQVLHVQADMSTRHLFASVDRSAGHPGSMGRASTVEVLDTETGAQFLLLGRPDCHLFAGDAQTVLRLGRGETVTSMCLWTLDHDQQGTLVPSLVVATKQGHDVGRILLIDTRHANALVSGDDLLAKLKVSKPIMAVQALDSKHLVVSVDYMLLVYTLVGSSLMRQQSHSTSRTVTFIDCKDGMRIGQCITVYLRRLSCHWQVPSPRVMDTSSAC